MHSTCLAQAQLYVTPKLAMSTRCFYSALDTSLSIHLWATLMETTQTLLPQNTRLTKLHGDSKAQSLTRPTTHAAISTFSTSHNSITSQKHNLSTSLAASKATQYSMLQIKPFIKTPFDLRHLIYVIILPLIPNYN